MTDYYKTLRRLVCRALVVVLIVTIILALLDVCLIVGQDIWQNLGVLEEPEALEATKAPEVPIATIIAEPYELQASLP